MFKKFLSGCDKRKKKVEENDKILKLPKISK